MIDSIDKIFTGKKNNPLVSIGLPVYNESRFLKQTLESLLSQDYENIEIIISDNASTDGTGEICEDYACRYSNIRYDKFEENRGLAKNYQKVLHDSKGEYFMWASGHDLWSSNYISACLEKIQNFEDRVLIVPASEWIDEKGDVLEKESGFYDTRGMDLIARYFTVFWGNMHPAYGLMRSKEIKSWPTREIIGSDMILLTFLSFRGDFVHQSKAMWSRRESRFEKSYSERLKRYKQGEQQVAKKKIDKVLPFVLLVYYLFCTVFQSKTPFLTKVIISFLLMPAVIGRYFSGKNQYNTG